MEWRELLSVFLILFSVIDIVGSLPVILDLKSKGFVVEPFKASLVSLVIMLVFLFLGKEILKLFGVDFQSFAVAGSIILFLIGLEMILGVTIFKDDKKGKKSAIVPIAFPLVAGAGTMTTILSLKAKFSDTLIILGIILNIVIVFVVLHSSDWLGRRLSVASISVMRKLFGIILLAIAIKLFRENFRLLVIEK
jgi:multiple antibiotic resistance protein